MRKLTATIALFLFMVGVTMASSQYKLNEDAIDQKFEEATKVNYAEAQKDALQLVHMSILPDKGKSVGGFLARWFICGALIWSHRKYMGTGGESVWYYYCIPVYGGVIACGEFFDVLFGGEEALGKYEGNSSPCVWCGG